MFNTWDVKMKVISNHTMYSDILHLYASAFMHLRGHSSHLAGTSGSGDPGPIASFNIQRHSVALVCPLGQSSAFKVEVIGIGSSILLHISSLTSPSSFDMCFGRFCPSTRPLLLISSTNPLPGMHCPLSTILPGHFLVILEPVSTRNLQDGESQDQDRWGLLLFADMVNQLTFILSWLHRIPSKDSSCAARGNAWWRPLSSSEGISTMWLQAMLLMEDGVLKCVYTQESWDAVWGGHKECHIDLHKSSWCKCLPIAEN